MVSARREGHSYGGAGLRLRGGVVQWDTCDNLVEAKFSDEVGEGGNEGGVVVVKFGYEVS